MDSFERPTYGKNKVKFDDSMTKWERFKCKYLTLFTLKKFVWALFRYALLIGISYVIIFPYYSKIATSFMTGDDLVDVSVKLVPKYPTLDTYKIILNDTQFFDALLNTALISLFCGVVQMLICSLVGYGFSKFNFKGKGILFVCCIITLVIPHKTLQSTMRLFFQNFNIWGIPVGNLLTTHWPIAIMSLTGIGYRNGLYIFMMRQFYKGVPDELEEAAYVDGAGVMKTYWKIIVPMAVPMMVTIFIFSFSWQWTDMFYTKMLYGNSRKDLVFFHQIVNGLPQVPAIKDLQTQYAQVEAQLLTAVQNAVGLLVLIPLVIIFLIGQKKLIQGIERTGVTG